MGGVFAGEGALWRSLGLGVLLGDVVERLFELLSGFRGLGLGLGLDLEEIRILES